MVNAETMEPFKEHHSQPDGSHFAEVEPNAEYWIRISSHRRADNKKRVHNKEDESYRVDIDGETDEEDNFDGEDCNFDCAECRVEVDSQDLGYSAYVSKNEVHDFGIWNRTMWTETNQAFKVTELNAKGDRSFWIGTVKVDFYKAIENGFLLSTCNDVSSHWKRGAEPLACANGGKAVKSCQGTTTKSTHSTPHSRSASYIRGDLLETITLRYCTAVGLLHVGVLPKPTAWEHQRRLFPAKTSTMPEALLIQPQIVNVQRRLGSKIFDDKSYELFDFTDVDERQAEYDANSKNASPAASRRKLAVRQLKLKRKLESCDWDYDPDDDDSDNDRDSDDEKCR